VDTDASWTRSSERDGPVVRTTAGGLALSAGASLLGSALGAVGALARLARLGDARA